LFYYIYCLLIIFFCYIIIKQNINLLLLFHYLNYIFNKNILYLYSIDIIFVIYFIPSFVIFKLLHKSKYCILIILYIPLSVILSLQHKFKFYISAISFIPSSVILSLLNKFNFFKCIILIIP